MWPHDTLGTMVGKELEYHEALGPCQRTSGVGHALWGVVMHISSERGAHVLHVVNAKPAACHCSTQEGELFS